MGSTGVSGISGLAKVVTGFRVVPELYDKSLNSEADKTMQNTNEFKTRSKTPRANPGLAVVLEKDINMYVQLQAEEFHLKIFFFCHLS